MRRRRRPLEMLKANPRHGSSANGTHAPRERVGTPVTTPHSPDSEPVNVLVANQRLLAEDQGDGRRGGERTP